MSPSVEYEPSPIERVREQVELYEATNGIKGGTLNGKPVVALTYMGAKSGKIRKTPLMRIEHKGITPWSLPMPALLGILFGVDWLGSSHLLRSDLLIACRKFHAKLLTTEPNIER